MTTSCPSMPAYVAPSVDSSPSVAAPSLLPLATLAIGFVMAMLDVTVVNVALPGIARQFHTPLSALVWIVDGYTLTFAALLLLAGALADRFGAKRVYLAGLAIFTAASLLCGVSVSADMLIAARLVQGFGAALFMPSSLSLLTHAYKDDRVRARMLAHWSVIVSIAGASGPLVGGMLIDNFGWRSVFLINLPVGLVGLWLARVNIASAARHARELSPVSHVLGVLFLSAVSYALIEGNVYGWTSRPILIAAVVAVASAVLLVTRERSHPHPVLPRSLYRLRGFGASNAIGFLINFGAYAQFFLISLYLQQAQKASAMGAGLLLLPMMCVFACGSFLSARISARLGLKATLVAGLSVGTAMGALAAFSGASTYGSFIVFVALCNLGIGAAVPAMTALTMQIAGHAYANSAAAALNANRQSGALVGVAVMGMLIHGLTDWPQRLVAAFAIGAVGYGLGVLLAWRRLGTKGQAAAVPAA
ncbi:MAG: MFS transporter [Bordetella sp.]|uniref:MFS transporter n=1 Tax=Bordetella sp. TaxID=28081 RepID=UPI003F7BE6DA